MNKSTFSGLTSLACSTSFWDEATHAWKAEPGEFTIRVGDSSKNTPLSASYTLQ